MSNIKIRGSYFFDVRNNDGLSMEVMQKHVPSLFATEPHESRSQRYTYIPTIEIIEALIKEGFVPVQAMQAKPRIEDKLNFAKHLVRFRRRDDLGLAVPDHPEIISVNSHDGTTSYHMMNGVFRTVCANGLISGDLENNFKARHSGNIIQDVIDVAFKVVGYADEVMETVASMKGTTLKTKEQLLLAEYALKARFSVDDEDDDVIEATAIKELAFTPQDILKTRRFADNSKDLYTTMNVLQENIIKGGISAVGKDGKKKTIRTVNGIDQNVKLNKMLWMFAEEIRKIHGTAV